jgi:two-component system phosphate regulon response regulator PhoB
VRPLILIVEDEPPLVEILRYNLDKEGFRVQVARDGEEALTLVAEEMPELVILDWMLPKLSGIEVCRRLRQKSESKTLPIIMLTARGEEADRIRGLDSGADDYVVKPFSPGELIARARAVLRRAQSAEEEECLAYADIIMDLAKMRVTRAGKPVKLGPTEFRLLKALMEKPGRVFSREQLLDKAWGRDIHVEPRTVDVHIRRLRQALDIPDLIRTVRSGGYAIDEEKS